MQTLMPASILINKVSFLNSSIGYMSHIHFDHQHIYSIHSQYIKKMNITFYSTKNLF